ncbi:hypothetical protein [Burkholderia metallica]|uniref:hypothetical protein n=1 Tax=Burkholderia metallica TaxID=488729 RepID=UPI001CF27D41|nr:hypothetical protein [Burkholderia metallica]MCA8018102.1 hypothetical protein [Burkholderia metallica]
MTHADPTGWSTKAEIEFIDQLVSRTTAITLLRGYLAGMSRRSNFCGMNPDAVIGYAQNCLSTLERHAA